MAKAPVEQAPEGKIRKLTISNFRGIGTKPVEIEIDDIVVLVGPNNSGKSSILRAYEIVMEGSSKNGQLSIDDFPNGQVIIENLPTIIVETIVENDKNVSGRWISHSDQGLVIKEKFTWSSPKSSPEIVGFLSKENRWATKEDSPHRPFGAPNIAQSRRPRPISVHAFQSPEKQAEEVNKVARDALKRKAAFVKFLEDDEDTAHNRLLEFAENYHRVVVENAEQEIKFLSGQLTDLISGVFPGYRVEFRPSFNSVKLSPDVIFDASGDLYMGPEGELLPISSQGSGAQRTLLWAALKVIAQMKFETDGRPQLLLIDEPELCLHPTAIREARETLYDLASEHHWQVMLTTHSPQFIDFSRPHTRIARVERDLKGEVSGTTVFRPDTDVFDENDKKNFKLLNICDVNVAEFLFGGPIVLVEGDTEYAAMKIVIGDMDAPFNKVNIVRARGKVTIASLCKILNQFGAAYSVLHDIDSPIACDGSRNPAWTNNQKILDAVNASPNRKNIRLLGSFKDFETAYLGYEGKNEKPYTPFQNILDKGEGYENVKALVQSLVDHAYAPPKNAIEWNNLADLEITQHEVWKFGFGLISHLVFPI